MVEMLQRKQVVVLLGSVLLMDTGVIFGPDIGYRGKKKFFGMVRKS